jgi:hypothetical protein
MAALMTKLAEAPLCASTLKIGLENMSGIFNRKLYVHPSRLKNALDLVEGQPQLQVFAEARLGENEWYLASSSEQP